ncbi:MAG: hypothetical protein QG635_172 [Bacteroidota bacterium]|nr:hypothetical protein [Bacteroidota bacterium]
MKDKTWFYPSLIVIIMAAVLVSCSPESKEKDTGSYSATIKYFIPKVFEIGDTIEIHGTNFGNERGTNYISFDGNDVESDYYISWSDSVIKVIVPDIPGDQNEGKVYLLTKASNYVDYEVKRHFFFAMIDWLVKISLGMTVIFIYLKINKIWKRKGEPEVADAQSLTGLGIYIANCILWCCYYLFVVPDTKSFFDTSVYILEGSIFFLIGTGLFVKGQKKFGLINLIMRSLKLERKEADYLIKRFFKPANADKILSILHQLAMIDEELDPKEQELLESFAREWNIEYSAEKLNKDRIRGSANNYVHLRKSLEDYLDTEPPAEQVAQLRDMMEAMIQADDKVSQEEELISTELLGIISNFLNKNDKTQSFYVLIVPQKPEQEMMISDLLPDAELISISGGSAFKIGSYYSQKYADMICRQYRDIQLFTIVHVPFDSSKN